MIDLTTTEAVEENREAIADAAADWIPQYREGRRIDWEGLIERLERDLDAEMPGTWDHPAMKAIKAICRQTAGELPE
jgi:hypothetical protein